MVHGRFPDPRNSSGNPAERTWRKYPTTQNRRTKTSSHPSNLISTLLYRPPQHLLALQPENAVLLGGLIQLPLCHTPTKLMLEWAASDREQCLHHPLRLWGFLSFNSHQSPLSIIRCNPSLSTNPARCPRMGDFGGCKNDALRVGRS